VACGDLVATAVLTFDCHLFLRFVAHAVTFCGLAREGA
jgi:hypothetical protein